GGDFPGSLVEAVAAAAGHPAPAPTAAGHADHQLLRVYPHFPVGNYADVQAEFAGRRVIRGRVQLGRVVRGQVPVAVEVVALDDPEIQVVEELRFDPCRGPLRVGGQVGADLHGAASPGRERVQLAAGLGDEQ